jgi:glycosyltransferase involved in cell wall biosynthesis
VADTVGRAYAGVTVVTLPTPCVRRRSPNDGIVSVDDTPSPQPGHPPLGELARRAHEAGIRRVRVLAYRDLDDEAGGGSELHLHEILRRWAAAGLTVDQRTVTAPGLPATTTRDGYRVERRGGRRLGVPRITLEAATRRLPAADAVVEVWNGVPFWTPLWWRGPRVVLLHHLHDELWRAFFPPPSDRLGSLVERRVAPWAYRGSPVVTLAASSRDELVERTPLRPSGVHVVAPGIHESFSPSGARAPRPLVVVVARLTSAKRVDAVVRAVGALATEVDGLRLVVVGDGPERPALRALADRLGLGDAVELAGRIGHDELVALYRQAWVVVSASVSEGWGMTLTEAAACGTPAVASDIVGHRDAVPDGCGLLVADDLDLEAALRKVLLDADLRARLGTAAAARARTLTWDATAAGVLGLLLADAERRRPRPDRQRRRTGRRSGQ